MNYLLEINAENRMRNGKKGANCFVAILFYFSFSIAAVLAKLSTKNKLKVDKLKDVESGYGLTCNFND